MSAALARAALALMALVTIAVGKTQAFDDSVPCPQRCNLRHGVCDPNGQCRCDSGYEGENCDQCTPATGCLHGTCDQPWQCNCEEGWGGRLCDQDIQYCERYQPCANGATCVNDGSGGFECACADGFTGTYCNVTKQPTSTVQSPTRRGNSAADFSHLCHNGGTCISGNQIVGCKECACPEGYGGKKCEAFMGMCNTRPCANGGRCHNTMGGFRCQCTPGYTGETCTVDVDECAKQGPAACANNGRCVNNIGSYACECYEGFEGARCRKPSRRLPLLTRLSGKRSFPTFKTTTLEPEGFGAPKRDEQEPEYRPPVHPAIANPFQTREEPKEAGREGRRYVTNVKVTHIVEQMVDPPVADASVPAGQASVSVVQAVTFAFLGVAVALFIGIAAFLWFHCARKQSQWPRRHSNDAERQVATTARPASRVYGEQTSDNRNSVIVVQRDAQKPRDSGYFKTQSADFAVVEGGHQCRHPRPSSVVRTLSASQRPDGGLYVALPQESEVRHLNVDAAVALADESRSFLPHARSHY